MQNDEERYYSAPPEALNRFFAALQPLTDLYGGREEFCNVLTANHAIIAGSFPLYFCFEPQPLSESTRASVAALGYLPPNVADGIGAALQRFEFDQDFERGDVDIDIFYGKQGVLEMVMGDDTTPSLKKPLREYVVESKQQDQNRSETYVAYNRLIDNVSNYRIDRFCVQLIQLDLSKRSCATRCLDSFDLACAQAHFDGYALKRPDGASMRTSARLEVVQQSLFYLIGLLMPWENRIAWRSDLSMPTRSELEAIVAQLQECGRRGESDRDETKLVPHFAYCVQRLYTRLEKYQRRGFLVENSTEYRAMIEHCNRLFHAIFAIPKESSA